MYDSFSDQMRSRYWCTRVRVWRQGTTCIPHEPHVRLRQNLLEMSTYCDPSSLEDQCLLQVIRHLEEYPSEVLASLSFPVCRRLLLNLPAADICLLENTGTAAGIDMEAGVWKEVFARRVTRTVVYTGLHVMSNLVEEPTGSYKQRYFDFTYNHLLNGRLELVGCLLFSVPVFPGVDSWGEIQFPFRVPTQRFTPYRHATSYFGERLWVHLMLVMMNTCKCLPENVEINDLLSFLTTCPLDNPSIVFSAAVKDIFFKTRRVSFLNGYYSSQFSIPQKILELIFSHDQVSLTALALEGASSFLRAVLAYCCVFFSSSSSCIEDHSILQSLYSRYLPSIPYNGLTSIDVENDMLDLTVGELDVVYRDFCLIVSYQYSLTSVVLELPDSDITTPLFLIETLGSLFLRPQFLYLHLGWLQAKWKEINLLLSKFLASNTANQACLKTLSFRILTPEEPPKMEDFSVVGYSDLSSKVLSFSELIIDFFDSFLQQLSQYPCTSLKSFTISCVGPLQELVSPMSMFADCTQVLLERLELEEVSLAVRPSPEVPFRNLFHSPNLRVVSFCYCDIGKEGILPALTQGLLQQVSTGGLLEELRLDGNALGDSSDAELQGFGDALFRLKTLSNLVLSIRQNSLKPSQFLLFHASWKRSVTDPNIRMRELLVEENDYGTHLAELQEVSDRVV